MEKIKKLKSLLKRNNIDGYIIPKNNEFFGEYTPDYEDRLRYISDFTGSYGVAIILRDKNFLFTDGRYTLQANKESGKFFIIKTIPKELPKSVLNNKKLKIGFDGKLFTKKSLKYFFYANNCELVDIKENLIDRIWKRKKKRKNSKFYTLPKRSVNQNYKQKIKNIVSDLIKQKADYKFITSSENVAWLLNIRGMDSKYSPIPNSYVLIKRNKKIKVFCNLNKISNHFKHSFKKIEFIDIKLINSNLLKLRNMKIIIDTSTCSLFFENLILKNNSILSQEDSINNLKAIKSKKEIINIKKTHIYDGVALTKFIFWIKKNYIKKNITEINAERKLFRLRRKNKNFKFLSFPTISGTGPNGAIIHYRATKQSNLKLKKGDIYLVDSGGQYNYGTTDVTRTISLNNSNERIKDIYTRVLKGHIAVASYKLNKKTSGLYIDKIARKYLKQINLDYAHGTGHGVGYFLNVHEGPHAISKNNNVKFKEGMVVSNEPGYYEKNKFGIRIENLIYVKKNKNKLYFDNLTMVPIDKSLIKPSILSIKERDWINKYHEKVFKNLKKFMNKIEFIELERSCSAI